MWKHTLSVTAGILAAVTLSVSPAISSAHASSSANTSSSGSNSALALWLFGDGTGVTAADAVQDAQRFHFIVGNPGAFAHYVKSMKAVNPQLRFLAYLNGAYAQANQGSAYPASWYARTASGQQIRSHGFGNYLMDPTSAGWIANRIAFCKAQLARSGYDGCYLDMLGSSSVQPGYGTGVPYDAAAHAPYTAAEWLAATERLAAAVKAAVPTKIVFGNGLQDGPEYYSKSASSRTILNGLDGAVAETWLRNPTASINDYPSVAVWQQNVNMLANAATAGKVVLVMTKTWVNAPGSQVWAWHVYSAASFLLGTSGDAAFTFLPSTKAIVSGGDRLARIPVGQPLGSYLQVGSVFRRMFSAGQVLVNPGTTTVTLSLGGRYRTIDGRVRTTITLPPHGANILLRV